MIAVALMTTLAFPAASVAGTGGPLWTTGSDATTNTGLGMDTTTSPSITSQPNSG
jgi:hypothetical protein